jgi:hypothetical protein
MRIDSVTDYRQADESVQIGGVNLTGMALSSEYMKDSPAMTMEHPHQGENELSEISEFRTATSAHTGMRGVERQIRGLV